MMKNIDDVVKKIVNKLSLWNTDSDKEFVKQSILTFLNSKLAELETVVDNRSECGKYQCIIKKKIQELKK